MVPTDTASVKFRSIVSILPPAKTVSRRSVHLGWFVALACTCGWAFVPGLTPVAMMFMISLTLFAVIKLHVLTDYVACHRRPANLDIGLWFVAWPGLNAPAFFDGSVDKIPARGEWVVAAANILIGAALLLFVVPTVRGTQELCAGWIALGGILFLIHFGCFHVSALIWRWCDRDVQPIMNAPVLSTSVTEFWSRRWNRAFRDYASRFIFRPLARATSPKIALLVGYLFSGLIHEMAISVPAGGGYGLPTLYFLIQACAMIAERAAEKSGFQISSSCMGWIWTVLVTVPTAYLLFHPAFVRNVVLPLVDWI